MSDDRKGEEVVKPADEPLPNGAHTTKADFDRNRDGVYGGRPEVRNPEKFPDK